MANLFEAITNDIVTAIKEGAGNYQMPWHGDASRTLPRNAVSGRAYRGINILLLWARACAAGFGQGGWATYRQWMELGGQVRRGQRGTTVLFWKPVQSNDGDGNDDASGARSGWIARAFTVFNADQIDGLTSNEAGSQVHNQRQEHADAFFSRFVDTIWHGSDHAFYDRASDSVSIPDFDQFISGDAYYAVLAHELTHWTGAAGRLDRNLTGRFGDEAYAMEELVTELGAAFTVGHLGLNCSPRHDHAPYIANWLEVLGNDPRAIVTAASKAQAAVDYLIGLQGITMAALARECAA